ncbi:MAG: FABP family protein [Actinomycetota bacterium]
MTDAPVPEALESLAFLIGRWRGEGEGSYPTIEPFRYGEEVVFSHIGKPFLSYQQRTWHPENGMHMHVESGFWRALPDARVEIVLAHPTGVVEIEEGRVEGSTIDVKTTRVASSTTAKNVTELRRRITVDEDSLTYELHMAAEGQPLQLHLRAQLTRHGS